MTLRLPLLALLALPTLAAFAQTAPPAPASSAPASSSPAARPASGAVVGDHNTALADRLPVAQQLTLQAGADSFGARHLADLSADHRGAALILHDSGQHQSWPRTVAALFEELPLFGWDTLAIELPPPAPPFADQHSAAASAPSPAAASSPAVPPTPAAPSTTPPSAAPTAPVDAETRAQARIDAALAKLAALRPGSSEPTVVIGFGSGAWRAAALAHRLGNGNPLPQPLLALVLVDPRQTLPGQATDLPALLPATSLPTFDIVQDSAAQTGIDAQARRRSVLHQKERVYRQVALPPLAGDTQGPSLLTRRIRGWMQQQADAGQTGADRPAR